MIVHNTTATKAADEILSLIASEKPVIVLGAFVSSRNPSSLPMASPIKDAILEGIWAACCGLLDSTVEPAKLSSFTTSRFSELPLELLVEQIINKTKLSVNDILGWLSITVPNTNHRVLATMSDCGLADIITTNFDELVEASAKYPNRIIKLHGTVSHPETMVARLSQVGQGRVSRTFRQSLRHVLNRRSVCFIGYAGRDLDILPILRKLNLKRVIWIARPSHSSADELAIKTELSHLSFLKNTAEHFCCLSTDADALFDVLALRLRVEPVVYGTPFDWKTNLINSCQTIHRDAAAIAFTNILGASGLWEQAAFSCTYLIKALCSKDVYQATVLFEAEARFWLGDYDIAKSKAKEAVRLFSLQGKHLEQARAYQILGLIAGRSTSFSSRAWAPRYMRQVEQLVASCSSEAALLISTNNYLNLGIWFKNAGRLSEAYDVLGKGLRQALLVGDFRAQEKLHHAIGIVFRRMRQLLMPSAEQSKIAQSARSHLKRAAELASYLGVTSEEARVLSTRVNLELDGVGYVQGAVYRANRLLDKLEKLVDKSWEPEQIGRVLEFRAIVLASQGRLRDAESIFTEALDLLHTNTAKASCLRGRASVRILLGFTELADKDIFTALEFLPPSIERDQVVALSNIIDRIGIIYPTMKGIGYKKTGENLMSKNMLPVGFNFITLYRSITKKKGKGKVQ